MPKRGPLRNRAMREWFKWGAGVEIGGGEYNCCVCHAPHESISMIRMSFTHDGPIADAQSSRNPAGGCAGRHGRRPVLAGPGAIGDERRDEPRPLDLEGSALSFPGRLQGADDLLLGRDAFHPAARYSNALIKLVPTEWGPPTFEIDGIKMLPTAQVSPFADAERKVGFIRPRGKVILDTCGGLGYFASWCLQGQAAQVHSYEKNPDVIWLRGLNPWSPGAGSGLTLVNADVSEVIASLPGQSFDAVLHDPPRFGIAGELYSQAFYDQLARVLKPRGLLFHYTGTPNKLTSGRDVPNEVANRLRSAGFTTSCGGTGCWRSASALLVMMDSGHKLSVKYFVARWLVVWDGVHLMTQCR